MPQQPTEPQAADVDLARLRTWLAARVASYLRTTPDQLDPAVPLPEYGLDSLHTVAVCADIEDEFGVIVDPTLLWDHPSIDALSAALSGELARR